jgi:hypothetical protein
MDSRKRLGLFVGMASTCLGIACSVPPPHHDVPRTKPVAVARVTSSKSTLARTDATTWRIYGGRTQLVVMGFGSDKKAVDGMRVRFATKSNLDWWLSLESLRKGGGMMRLAPDGNRVVLDTTTGADKELMHGAMRALSAYAKRLGGSNAKTVAFADDPCSLTKLAERAAACVSARPVCKKVGTSKALLCSSGVAKCSEDAAKASEACAAKAGKTPAGKTEKAKNPAPKLPEALQKLLGGSSGGGGASSGGTSSGGTSSGGATKASSGGTKSTSGGTGTAACKDDPVDCPGKCAEEDSDDCPDSKKVCEEDGDAECAASPKDEDAENGDDEVADDDTKSEDDVDPDPDPSAAEPEETPETNDDSSFDEGGGDVMEASRLVFGTGIQARTAPTNVSDPSCGAARVLVCAGRSRTGGFCRCVAR